SRIRRPPTPPPFPYTTLFRSGYRVIEAGDGPTALAALDAETGSIDLLFTDVVLPRGMTGAVLAAEAQAKRPVLKVLFTTGYARKDRKSTRLNSSHVEISYAVF